MITKKDDRHKQIVSAENFRAGFGDKFYEEVGKLSDEDYKKLFNLNDDVSVADHFNKCVADCADGIDFTDVPEDYNFEDAYLAGYDNAETWMEGVNNSQE